MGSCLGRRSDFSSELLGEDYEHHEPPPPYEVQFIILSVLLPIQYHINTNITVTTT